MEIKKYTLHYSCDFILLCYDVNAVISPVCLVKKDVKSFKKSNWTSSKTFLSSHWNGRIEIGLELENRNLEAVTVVLYCTVLWVCVSLLCFIILLLCLQISVCLSHFGWHCPVRSVSWPLSLLCSCFVFCRWVKVSFLSLGFLFFLGEFFIHLLTVHPLVFSICSCDGDGWWSLRICFSFSWVDGCWGQTNVPFLKTRLFSSH